MNLRCAMRQMTLAAMSVLILLPGSSPAEDSKRKIRLIQDDAQVNLVTKVYKMKYAGSTDLLPFVQTAVMRYNKDSEVQSLVYTDKKEEYLVVSTGEDMLPYIDDMISKLDRNGKKDENGSLVEGTGISRFVYYPKNRATEKMKNLVQWFNNYGEAWYDASSSMIYWKDSKYDGNETLKWLQALDRPVPQVELMIKVYRIRDSDLSDIGVDYLAWKNGPGLEIFGAGYEAAYMRSIEQLMAQSFNLTSQASNTWGGFFAAPQFDMSFVRMLDQSGRAKAVSTGRLVVVNDFDNSYNIKFTPDYDNIIKDMDTDQTKVVSSPASFELTVKSPIICFKQTGKNTDADFPLTVSDSEGTIIFGYEVTSSESLERNNFGAELVESSTESSSLNLDFKVEKLLATWDKMYDVEQVTGMPFISDIPYVGYLTSTTTKVKVRDHMIVTVSAQLINPDAKLQDWAGEVISAAELPGPASTVADMKQ